MLQDISFKQELGYFHINWVWCKEIESVEIRYKKSEIYEGEGALFTSERVLKRPGNGVGSIHKRLINEWGLYTFFFQPYLIDGRKGERSVCSNIMVGKKKNVFWEVNQEKERRIISFEGNEVVVPPGIIHFEFELEGKIFLYESAYQIDRTTRLVIPFWEKRVNFAIRAKKPYDKAYCIIKR